MRLCGAGDRYPYPAVSMIPRMSFSRTVVGRDPQTSVPIAVDIEDGHVTAMRETSSDTTEWIAPGLVDLQVNGFAGFDFNAEDPDAEHVVQAARGLLTEGITTFVPTLITASHEQISARLRAVVEARRQDELTAHMVPYVHLEGPHLSEQDGPRGVHDRAFVRPPSLDEFEDWQTVARGLIGMVTLSPHYAGSAEYIAALTGRSVRISIGHTHADDEQITRAVEAGARLDPPRQRRPRHAPPAS